MLYKKDTSVYRMLIALYLLINQALIKGLGIGSSARAL